MRQELEREWFPLWENPKDGTRLQPEQTNLLRLPITYLASSAVFLPTPPKSSIPQHKGPQVTLRRHRCWSLEPTA